MPTIIDALVVTLGLDDRKYRDGAQRNKADLKSQREESAKTSKEMEANAKRGMEAFSNLRREIVGLFAAFTAGVGLKDFVQQTIQSDAATGRLAKNLDMSVEAVSAWQGVLKRNGGSADDASNGLQKIADVYEQISLYGNMPLAQEFNALKVPMEDLKDSGKTLLDIADAFHKMDPKQAAALGASLGFSPALIALLEKGRGAVAAMLVEQRKLGVITQADAEAAQKLQNSLSGLAQSSATLGRTVLTELEPAIDAISAGMTVFAGWIEKNQPIMVGLLGGLTAAVVALSLPLLAVAGEVIVATAPFIALGLAIGVVVEALIKAVQWFEKYDAARNKHAAGHISPSASVRAGGGPGRREPGSLAPATAPAVAATAASHGTETPSATARRAATTHGLIRDFEGLIGGANGAKRPEAASPTGPVAASPTGQTGASATTPGAAAQAAAMIRGFENFIASPKWDVNHLRIGYGSDTTTDPTTGKVSEVTSSSRVTREQAEADLQRRIKTEFMPKTAAAVGAAWSKMNDATKASLTSLAYNYGSIRHPALKDALAAARSGDNAALATAIRQRGGDNGGINISRRYTEAAAIADGAPAQSAGLQASPGAQGLVAGAAASYAAHNDNRATNVTTRIDNITIQTQATDAAAIAAEIGPAIRQRGYVTQSNTGLG